MYKQKTEILGIPVPGHETLRPDIELLKYQMIENQLIAGMNGMRSCIFEEGRYVVKQETDSEYTVTLIAVGDRLPFTGIIDRLYAEEKTELAWRGLFSGKMYWLYLTAGPKLAFDKCDVRTLVSEAEIDTMKGRYLLVATVDITSEPVLNLRPDGKMYSAVVVGHSSETKNPHGESVTQTELNVLRKVTFTPGDGPDSVIVVRDGRATRVPTIDSDGEIILKDKRLLVSLSDSDTEALLTDSQSIVGALNELLLRVKKLEG